jgi:hypothetical protein
MSSTFYISIIVFLKYQYSYAVVGSNPASATTKNGVSIKVKLFFFYAQMGRNLQIDVYLMFTH